MRADDSSLPPLGGVLGLYVVFAALLLTLLSPSARAETCPNEAVRAEQGAASMALPECRAYEFVTPGSTPFVSSTNEEVEGARASVDGDGLAYYTRYPAPDADRGDFRYLARRSSSGWSVEDVAPQDSPTSSILLNCEQALDFSPDLSKSILSDGWNPAEEGQPGYCSEAEEVLVPGAPRGYGNLYLREGSGGTYQLLNLTPDGTQPANALLQDYTSNFSRILFSEAAQLTPEAPTGDNLYLWSDGLLHLIPFLPNGEPVSGTLANGGSLPNGTGGGEFGLAAVTHAMSPDGEDIFFYANGNLYLRRNAVQPQSASGACTLAEPTAACTVQIDRKQGGSGESGGGVFWYASEDGSRVFFTSESKLTGDSQAVPGKPDLYEYEVSTGFLRDRTHTGAVESPNARGFSGAGDNAEYLYFVARGVLAGSGANSKGAEAQPFKPNLYLLHDGIVIFIATLDDERDNLVWQESDAGVNNGKLTTAVSPNGRYFAFATARPLTGADNAPADPGGCLENACKELFLFDAQEEQLTCVSCGPGAPAGETTLPGPTGFSGKSIGRPGYFARQVHDDGRVFFTTPNALAAADLNGEPDVYRYLDGESRLISSGSAVGASVFLDASSSGSDVFFTTAESLVGWDTDNAISIYDARVGGGFPEPPPPAAPCGGESCRGGASLGDDIVKPGSLSFSGPQEGPNHPRKVRCKRGFVKRHGKCKKVRHHKRKHHRRTAK
jgi:hypothetical protein